MFSNVVFHPARDPVAGNDFQLRVSADSEWDSLLSALPCDTDASRSVYQEFQTFLDSSPRAKTVMAAVQEGFDRIKNRLDQLNLSASDIFQDKVIWIEAVAAALGACTHKRMVEQVECAVAIHLLDDQFDSSSSSTAAENPERAELRRLFMNNRMDIARLADEWPGYGDLIKLLASESSFEAGFYQGIQRVLYGGLIPDSDFETQKILLAEFRTIFSARLNGAVAQSVSELSDFTFYLTNKAAMELFPIEGHESNWNLNEVRSLCYTPLLLLLNLSAEVKSGQMRIVGEKPDLEELVSLVQKAGENLYEQPLQAGLFLEQLNFSARVFGALLPEKLRAAYSHLEVSLRDRVVVVDEQDNPVGSPIDKLAAHEQGLLHRAFSVFVVNSSGEMLIHQRALEKYHSGGLWTNACCGHPLPGEEAQQGATRRLFEEMGLKCELEKLFIFTYKAKVEDLTEFEIDHVFLAKTDRHPDSNSAEVRDWQWLSLNRISELVGLNPDQFTPWFKIAFPKVKHFLELQSSL